jgi:hypothetical protein
MMDLTVADVRAYLEACDRALIEEACAAVAVAPLAASGPPLKSWTT